MNDLVALAQAQLADGGLNAARRGCWVARTALEELVDELLDAKQLDPGPYASMRSRLSCLEVAYADRPGLAAKAHYAWTRLSQACHHHAYELSPSYTEAVHLLGIVQSLSESGAQT